MKEVTQQYTDIRNFFLYFGSRIRENKWTISAGNNVHGLLFPKEYKPLQTYYIFHPKDMNFKVAKLYIFSEEKDGIQTVALQFLRIRKRKIKPSHYDHRLKDYVHNISRSLEITVEKLLLNSHNHGKINVLIMEDIV